METLPQITDLAARDTASARAPLKVCMYLANIALGDFRVMRDARALAEAGFKVTIVDLERDHSRPTEEDCDGVHVQHIFVPGWHISSRFKPWFLMKFIVMTFYGVIYLLRTEADIYHAHVEKALPACYIAARLRRKPLIFDAPDLTLSDPSILRWRRLRALSIYLLAQIVPRCAAVITASPRYVPELRKLYRASNVMVVRNVPVYQEVSRSERLRQALGLGPEVRIALYQGNIISNRGLDALVRAAKFLEPKIVIVMMGWMSESVGTQIEALIASEGLAERVKLLPAVPYTELLDWTASADMGLTIFPPDHSLSIRFTLPNKLFEYMMAGLPVLSSQLEAIAEVIQTYDIGQIVPAFVPSDIGAAINTMLTDTAALERMRNNALEAARHEFHWEIESQKLISLYRTILSS